MAKHRWYTDEDGAIDNWRLNQDIHNGPECSVCRLKFCHHCQPGCYGEECSGPRRAKPSIPSLREYLVANFLGGEEGGLMSMRADKVVDEITMHVSLWLVQAAGAEDQVEDYYR